MIDITKFESVAVDVSQCVKMYVSKRGVYFSKKTITALGSPSHVRFLYDDKSHIFVLVAEPEAGKDAFPFTADSRSRIPHFTRRNLRLTCDKVFGKTEADYPYSVEGYKDTTEGDRKALVFTNEKKGK